MKEPILYLLMRTDIPSMNPGKLGAQTSHVTNAFENKIQDLIKTNPRENEYVIEGYKKWKSSTSQGFGTAICLGIDDWLNLIITIKDNIQRDKTIISISDVIVDPSYPCQVPREVALYLNLKIDKLYEKGCSFVMTDSPIATFLRPEKVGGYVFGDKEELSTHLKDFPLYP